MKVLYLLVLMGIFSCHQEPPHVSIRWKGDTLAMYVSKDVVINLDTNIVGKVYHGKYVLNGVFVTGKKVGKDTLPITLHLLQWGTWGAHSFTRNADDSITYTFTDTNMKYIPATWAGTSKSYYRHDTLIVDSFPPVKTKP